MATAMIVVVIPRGVLLQPTVSMMDEGQAMYMKAMPLIVKTPNTPNHSSVSTLKETISPMDAPRRAAAFVVEGAKRTIRSILARNPLCACYHSIGRSASSGDCFFPGSETGPLVPVEEIGAGIGTPGLES